MSKFEGQYLTLEQAALLYPLFREIRWLSEQEIDCGAIAYFMENENYSDACVKDSLRYLREESPTHPNGKIPDEVIRREIDIAEALLHLPEEHREMVCAGRTHTQKAFDILYAQDKPKKSRIIIPGMH